MIKLVPIDDIKASSYNPRKNDRERLAQIELSLKKLGFVLPVYADASGEIVSGHQRQMVARKLGYRKIPVEYIRKMDEEERKAINVLYNRATNDFRKTDTPETLKKEMREYDLESIADGVDDIVPNTQESFPCVYKIVRKDTKYMAKVNHEKFNAYMATCSASLTRRTATSMPIVISEEDTVINGIGRLQDAVEKKKKFVKCVVIPKNRERLAYIMLNKLTMDFSIDGEYADVLRYNAFMRELHTRETDENGNYAFGNGFFKGIFPKNRGRDFFELKGKAKKIWVDHYGESIVDFGAGKLNNTRTLRKAGIRVAAFEPYFVGVGNKVHKEKSREITEKFLEDVKSGTEYSSVFISSVFNSVPFIEDRKKIAWILAALCSPKGKVVCWCQSNKAGQFKNAKTNSLYAGESIGFEIDYEPNTTITQLDTHPKVQKGHKKEELFRIFTPCFNTMLRCDLIEKFWYLEAEDPVIDPERLAEAIDFEFDLPYPDGTKLGMSEMARDAFEKRLGIKLPEVKHER